MQWRPLIRLSLQQICVACLADECFQNLLASLSRACETGETNLLEITSHDDAQTSFQVMRAQWINPHHDRLVP